MITRAVRVLRLRHGLLQLRLDLDVVYLDIYLFHGVAR